MTNQWLAIDLTKSIIKEYIPLGEEIRTRYSNDIIKNTISIVICNNPCIVSNLTFHEAVELSLTNKEIKKRLLEEVNSYVNHIHYKKYKIKYGETIRQCKKLKKMNEHEESYENELNKLLLLILDAQVKVKKKQLK